MDYVAIDVETANPDLASICQIGIVQFSGGNVADSWSTYVNPEDYFDPMNVEVHGIDSHTVAGAPTFAQVHREVASRLSGSIVVCHTTFDRAAVSQALSRYALDGIDCTWLDSARVARRCWEACSQHGYGLQPVAEMLSIQFRHHDAAEDARVAGLIVAKAVELTGLSVSDWLDRVRRPIDPTRGANGSVAMAGNSEGELFGTVVVFTGALAIPRIQAARMAASVGCEVADGVNKHTTLLVVGDQDARKLLGHEKSSKHRKAEELIAKGHPIRILAERDFARIVGMAN